MRISDVTCLKCGSLYLMAESVSVRASLGREDCAVCGNTLATWSDRRRKSDWCCRPSTSIHQCLVVALPRKRAALRKEATAFSSWEESRYPLHRWMLPVPRLHPKLRPAEPTRVVAALRSKTFKAHAAGGRNRSGPMSPCSKSLRKIPCGQRTKKQAGFISRIDDGRGPRSPLSNAIPKSF